jgi:pyrrolidone-carboxylate peptidase
MHRKALCMSVVLMMISLCLGMSVGGSNSVSTGTRCIKTASVQPIDHRVIMLTGFWNPTGQMLIPFSTDSELNPAGWQGENWEGLGYDIYSYFPQPGVYTGMFEVDYQDTWEDFWNVTDDIHPFAIISFGAGAGPWEIEYNARNLATWVNDGKPPYQPTPCPPDDTQPAGYVRHSSLPVQQIADAVDSQTSLNAWVDWDGNPGAYLCEFIAYLGMWYHDTHNVSGDEHPCRAAGFIHVNAGVAVEDAMNATMVTIRETIDYLEVINNAPAAPMIDGQMEGTVGQQYTYMVVTSDADLDYVDYYIDWDDGSNSGWIGPGPSGTERTANHLWTKKGAYTIKAKARDVYGAESNWGTLEVTMPLSLTLPMQSFWDHVFERFSNMFPILRYVRDV